MKATASRSRTKQPNQELGGLQTTRGQARCAAQIAAPPIVDDVLRSPGQALDASTRAFMEPRFGHDFSKVRVHHDAQAAESAQAVQARAFTVGQSMVFGAGNFAPATRQGRELLAHELAHTLQQRSGSSRPLALEDAPASFEAAADAAAHEVGNGKIFSGVLPASGVQIQRRPIGSLQWKHDVKVARYRGRLMAKRIRNHGLLSKEARAKANEELAYFEGEAKEAYLREVTPALAPLIEIEMPPMDLRPASPEPAKPEPGPGPTVAERDYEGRLAYYSATRQAQLEAVARGPDLDGLSARQRLRIWIDYWADRSNRARADLIASQRVERSRRLAAQEKAEDEEATANWMLSGVNDASEYFIAVEEAGRKNLTWEEANRAISEHLEFRAGMLAVAGAFAAPAMFRPGGLVPPRRSWAPPSAGRAAALRAKPTQRLLLKASPPPAPARPAAPVPMTDVEVVRTNVFRPTAIKPQSPGTHQADWQARHGSGTAPAAYRDAEGHVRISTDHPLMGGGKGGISPIRSPGAPAATTSARTPSTASAPQRTSPTAGMALEKTGQAPVPAKPVADPLAKTPAVPHAQAPRGHVDPPQAISRDAVERMQKQPVSAAARKGRGSNVNYTIDREAHDLAWKRAGGHGDSPPAFIYDKQVYLDPSRWPRGQ